MSGLPNSASTRDLRIDFFRGLALIMIFINHMPAQPWHGLTLRSWGFSDSAEVFVLLAGIASAIAYGRWFVRGEYALGAMAVGSRVWTLYLTHLMLFLMLGAIAIYAAERFNETSYLEALGFDVFLQSPASFLGHVLTLTFLPGYLDILPLYVLLLTGLPAMFWLAGRHWLAPLAVSLVLYVAAQFLPLNMPNTRTAREWFFNPAAWQLLFVIGFTIGMRMRQGAGLGVLAKPLLSHSLTIIAVLYALAALAIAAPWREFPGYENVVLINPASMGTISKTDLHPLRLVDTLLKLWLVIVLVRPGALWLSWAPARGVQLLGKHSLEVFAALTVLSAIGSIVIIIGGFHPGLIASAVIGGVILMLMLAWGLEWRANRIARLSRSDKSARIAEIGEASPGEPPPSKTPAPPLAARPGA
jgi:hypothetical protein